MRKDRKQQKRESVIQLELFSYTGKPIETVTDGIGAQTQSGVELSSQLKEQRIQTQHLLDNVLDYRNLQTAYRQVKRNGGIGGVDGMEVGEFGQWLGVHHETLKSAIREQRYEVSAVKKVEIPKANGGKRMLGIPTVKDRFIQQAIHQQLSPIYEEVFSEFSYGFRPDRSAHQAIRQASEYIASGKEWVVDIDLEKFFDKINHDRLMQRLSKRIGDKGVLRLIHKYLKAGILTGGLVEQRIAGTPQGGPLSPLLSNIVLDELDKELEKRGHHFCRYADDCNIYVSSKKAGERVLESIVSFIEKRLKLKVNREKSEVFHCSATKFLGFTLLSGGKIRVSDKSISRLKDKVRIITKRNRGTPFFRVIEELNRVIIGWANYYRIANSWLSALRDLDGWIRRKLRCYRLKQCGRRFTIFKFLRSLEAPVRKSWNAIMYTGGWWGLSNKVVVKHAMGLEWFVTQGLKSLKVQMLL